MHMQKLKKGKKYYTRLELLEKYKTLHSIKHFPTNKHSLSAKIYTMHFYGLSTVSSSFSNLDSLPDSSLSDKVRRVLERAL